MRLPVAATLALSWFGVAGTASAEEHALRRYEAALQLGYSSGSVLGVPGFTFIGLEAGYHLSPRFRVGPYAEVGFIDSVVQRQEGPETSVITIGSALRRSCRCCRRG